MADNDPTLASGDPPPRASGPPPSVPGFRLLRKLGEGGMGIVFEAEQEHPRRRVALKVARGWAIADELHVRLFRREADMLARLIHPNIAAILETGQTEDGNHWFAMELVEGETLDQWLAHQRKEGPRSAAALRDRLEILRTVCDAVQYAHQRGVIHRDLKPTNLIVPPPDPSVSITGGETSRSGRPLVKVLDFGLARFTDPDPDSGAAQSVVGVIRGTLPYMSPEQTSGDPAAVDVRADVYALGVILHEMLVDRRPYDVPSGLMEAIRTIAETEPPPLADAWPGPGRPDADLDTIVRKALAKAPDQRYASVAALGEDLRRWLASEPILARPPSAIYQLKKLVSRHRAAFSATAVVLMLIVGAAVGMSVLYLRSERNLARALVAEKTAQAEAGTAKHTYDFLAGIFDVSEPDKARGEKITAREILERGADRIRHELAEEPLVRARLMATIGKVYQSLGMLDRARPLLEESLTTRIAELGPAAAEVAIGRCLLGSVLQDLGDFPRARAEFEQAIALLEQEQPSGREIARCFQGYGFLLGQLGEGKASLEKLERARSIGAERADASPLEMASVLNTLSTAKIDVQDMAGAGRDIDQALAILHELGVEEAPLIADLLTNRGIVEQRTERLPEALASFERALAIREKHYDPGTKKVIEALANLALVNAQMGRFDRAIPMLEKTLHAMEKAYGPDHPSVAQTCYNLGFALLQSGDPAGARAPLERALAMREKILGPENETVSATLYSLAEVHRAAGDLRTARQMLERVLAIDEKLIGPDDPGLAEDLTALSAVLRQMGERRAAEAAEGRAQAIANAAKARDEAAKAAQPATPP